ncbi:MAG: EF-hand domain-containing protein [Alphaproteobacteria bacterium]|nr:EF-hand domain-containing protein [Alphaproteobacteria bacterium]
MIQQELQKSAGSKFDAADSNKDGFLSPEETAASLAKLQAQKQTTFSADDAKTQVNRVKNRMKNADENEDGNVSKKEYQSYMNNHQANFDRNGDGIISKDEYRADSEKLPSNYRKK